MPSRGVLEAIESSKKNGWPVFTGAVDKVSTNELLAVRYAFLKFNKEFSIVFSPSALNGYYAFTGGARQISGLPPVTYQEFYLYLLYAFCVLYKAPPLSFWYDFIVEWSKSNNLDLEPFFEFQSLLETELASQRV